MAWRGNRSASHCPHVQMCKGALQRANAGGESKAYLQKGKFYCYKGDNVTHDMLVHCNIQPVVSSAQREECSLLSWLCITALPASVLHRPRASCSCASHICLLSWPERPTLQNVPLQPDPQPPDRAIRPSQDCGASWRPAVHPAWSRPNGKAV